MTRHVLQQFAVGVALRVQFVQPGTRTPIDFVEFAGVDALREIILQPPRGPARTFSAIVADQNAARIEYQTAHGDLDQFGLWQIQGRVSNADRSRVIPSEPVTFEVTARLDPAPIVLRPRPVSVEACARRTDGVG